MNDDRPDWATATREQKIALMKPAAEKGRSARDLADLFQNCTRNAVIGFVVRNKKEIKLLGKPAKPSEFAPKAKVRNPKPVKVKEYRPPAPMPTPTPEPFIPEDQRLSLIQLTERTCKWPIGDPLQPGFYFCGQHSDEESPYCEFHHRRAIRLVAA